MAYLKQAVGFTGLRCLACGLVIVGVSAARPALAASEAHYASGWAVNNDADWTPYPPNTNPLGAPNDYCTGVSTPTGSWADFTFPAYSIPGGNVIQGVEVRFNYLSQSGSNTAQLKKSGVLTGSTRTVPEVLGQSYCSATQWVSAGGMADLWGAALTPGDFNSASISVRLTQDANTIDLDALEMIVYYGPVNSPPTAEAGGPYAVAEGGSVMVSGAGSSDPNEPAAGLAYAWDLDDDGTFETPGITATFSAAGLDGPSARTIKLRVTDSGMLSDVDSATVNVSNVAPTVAVPTVSPEPSDEGASATASATFSDPAGPADVPYTCTVDYGDGSGPLAGSVAGTTCTGPSHTYTADGSFTVTVKVTDKDGGTGTRSGSHTVANVPPTVDTPTVSPEPSDEGSAATASATFSDPGGAADGPFTCTVDYGDGSGAQAGSVSGTTCTGPSHTYADNGSYPVEVSVTDKDGGTGSQSASHQVDNVAPEITASTSSAEECGATPEGGVVEVSADFSDPGFDSAVAGTFEDFTDSTIDWGDGTVDPATVDETPGGVGTPTTGTVSGSHTYASGGVFTVTLEVADDDGGTDTVTLTAKVTGAGLNGGELQVVGTPDKDVVNVQVKGDSVEVMAGFLGTPGKVTFPAAAVTSLRVETCAGDDQIHVNHDVTVPAVLDGGPGDDHVRAGGGPSEVHGGPGADHLFAGDAGAVLDGGEGDDVLQGGPASDALQGGPGDDRLFGKRGDDLLDGGPGTDTCQGGPGTDTLVNCE